MTSVRSIEVLCSALHKQSNDQTEQTKDGAEDLNNKNLDETAGMSVSDRRIFDVVYVQRRISGICQRCATSIDTNRNTADQVAHADCKSSPEQCVAGEVVGARVELLSVPNRLHLRGEDDGHNDTVNGNNFAEDDGDQVLRSYPGSLDTTTDDGYTGCEDTPAMRSEPAQVFASVGTYQADPTTERPMHRPMPKLAQVYGDMDSRNCPTLNASPSPLNSMSARH